MTSKRRATGAEGERLAREHLMGCGYRILDSNWRCRAGELDIIAETGGVLVFVEVRTRSAASMHAFGSPEESVDYRKRMKLRQLAQLYMQQTNRWGVPVRFDVIGVTLGGREAATPSISHLQDVIA